MTVCYQLLKFMEYYLAFIKDNTTESSYYELVKADNYEAACDKVRARVGYGKEIEVSVAIE